MKWMYSLLLAGLLAGTTKAQEVIYSTYQKFDSRAGDFAVAGKVAGYTYTYRSNNSDHYLDAWDDSMNLAATIVLDFFPDKIYETRFVTYPDKLIVFYEGLVKGKALQYAALLDAQGRLRGTPQLLGEARVSILGGSGARFSSAVSDDKRHLLSYRIETDGKTAMLTGTILSDSLKKSARIRAAFSADNDVEASDVLVGNDGSLYLTATTPTGNKSFSDVAWLLRLAPGTAAFQRIPINLNGRYASGTFLRLDNSINAAYIAGFYSDKKAGNNDGVLFARYTLGSDTLDRERYLPFDETLRTATGERSKSRALNDFDVRQLIVKSDGGFVLTAEQYFITTRQTGMGGFGYYSWYYSPMSMAQTVREYNYNDVLALSYSADGTQEWSNFIRKEQYSQEDGGRFSSYGFLNGGAYLGFLFNDFRSNGSRIQFATIDAKGSQDIHSLASGSKDDPDWLPRMGKQTGARELVIPCLRKKQICFARVLF